MAGRTRISSRNSAAGGVVKRSVVKRGTIKHNVGKHNVGKHPEKTAVSKTDSQKRYHLIKNAQKLAAELCSPLITVLAFYR